jgi:hypothetical protein
MVENNNDVITIGDLVILSERGIRFYKNNSYLTTDYELKNFKMKVFIVKNLYYSEESLIVEELNKNDNRMGIEKKHFRLAAPYEIKIYKLKNSFIKN